MKKSIILLVILLLALGLFAGCSNAVESGGRLATPYIDVFNSGTYYMKYRLVEDYGTMVVEFAMDGDIVACKTKTDDSDLFFVMKDGKVYYKEIVTTDIANQSKAAENAILKLAKLSLLEGDDVRPSYDIPSCEINSITKYSFLQLGESPFQDIEYVYKKSGIDEFLGVFLDYEEYSCDEGAIRFFFKGGKLAGAECNYTEWNYSIQMEILEMTGQIPSGMFDIPEGCEVRDL